MGFGGSVVSVGSSTSFGVEEPRVFVLPVPQMVLRKLIQERLDELPVMNTLKSSGQKCDSGINAEEMVAAIKHSLEKFERRALDVASSSMAREELDVGISKVFEGRLPRFSAISIAQEKIQETTVVQEYSPERGHSRSDHVHEYRLFMHQDDTPT